LLTNDENVGQSSGEGSVVGIFDVNDVETSMMLFTVSNDTNSTHVTTTSDKGQVTAVEFDKVSDLARFNIEFNSVVDFDERVGVTDGTTIVGGDSGDSLGSNFDFLDLEELVFSFISGNSVDGESTFYVVDETEVFTGLFHGDNVHKTRGVGGVSADFSVNLNKTLHKDRLNFLVVEGILQSVS